MHARFNLDPGHKNWSEYLDLGRGIHEENKRRVEVDLDKFKNADGNLEAKEIIGNWFPKVRASVFLSHSRKDEDIVKAFGGWLHAEFGLESFIDSVVWGYSDALLKTIDNKYCKNESGGNYNYDLRNRSTSHVHMMLSTALADMIDQSECIIFINTQNSFKPTEYFKDEGETESPWIYSEIAMTRMLRQRSPEEHRIAHAFDSINASLEHLRESKSVPIVYPANLYHLTSLTTENLEYWSKSESGKKRGPASLDGLYSLMKEK